MTRIYIEAKTFTDTEDPSRPRRKLLSLGMVSDDGRTLYAVNDEAAICAVLVAEANTPAFQALPLKQDPVDLDRSDPDVFPFEEIHDMFRKFLADTEDPELWSREGQRDQHVIRELFGYYTEAMYPPGFPAWIASVSERCARLNAVSAERSPRTLDQAPPIPERHGARRHHALVNAYDLMRRMHRADEVEQNLSPRPEVSA